MSNGALFLDAGELQLQSTKGVAPLWKYTLDGENSMLAKVWSHSAQRQLLGPLQQ